MWSACEHLPVEIWTQIIRDALSYSSLVDIDNQDQNQHTFEQEFRHYDINVRLLVQQEQEHTRRSLRGVCHSWRTLTDLTFGGWCKVDNLIAHCEIHPPNIRIAWRIDCFLTPKQGFSEQMCTSTRAIGKVDTAEETQHYNAQILTLNSPVSPVDSFLYSHGRLFPYLQVLDLRPACTFLTPTGGVSAGPDFFSTLSSLFPSLSVLLVDLPPSGLPDIIRFPRLRRLSYNIIGQSRLSDYQRCGLMAEWSLPMIEHVSFNPVGCDEDWEMLMSGMKVWGASLKSLCWEAEFPHKLGITIGATDWSACPYLIDLRYNTAIVRRAQGAAQSIGDIATQAPAWHPFNRIQISQGEVSSPAAA